MKQAPRTALTSAKTHHPPLPHQAMSPKSDTNPLTRLVHMYYIHPRLARHTPKPKEEPKTQGEALPWPTRGLNVQAHPKGRSTRRPTAQANAAISSYKGPGYPFPSAQAMECPQTIRGRPRPTTPLPIQRFPLPDAFTPAHCAPVSRVGQPTPGLARPSCPCLSRRPRHPSTRRMHRDAGYESPPQAVCSPSAVRSCAAAGRIGPTQP